MAAQKKFVEAAAAEEEAAAGVSGGGYGYVYYDRETATVRTCNDSVGLAASAWVLNGGGGGEEAVAAAAAAAARCKGCGYLLMSREQAAACRYCLADLNARNKRLRASLHETQAELLRQHHEMDFLRSWDARFIDGTAAAGDLTIRAADGITFTTYRFLLASKSAVFRRMLLEDPGAVELEIRDIPAAPLGALLAYMWDARVEAATLEKHAAELLLAAGRYLVLPLKTACERYLCGEVRQQNVVSMLELAFKSSAEELKETAFRVASTMHSDFMACSQLKSLLDTQPRIAAEMLKEILLRSNGGGGAPTDPSF